MGEHMICIIEILIATVLFLTGEIVKIKNYKWYKQAIKDSIHISDTKNQYLKKIHLKYNNMQKLNALYENSYMYAKRNVEKFEFLAKSNTIFAVTVLMLLYEIIIIMITNSQNIIQYPNKTVMMLTEILLVTYILIMMQTAIIFDTTYQKKMFIYSVQEALSMSKTSNSEIKLSKTKEPAKNNDNPKQEHIPLSKEDAKILQEIMTEYF